MLNEKLDQHQLRRVSDHFRWGYKDGSEGREPTGPKGKLVGAMKDLRRDDYDEGHAAGRIDSMLAKRRAAVKEAVVESRKGDKHA